MKTILSSRRDHYLTRLSIFLITVALIAGMVGCKEGWVGYDLTIAITEGGSITRPRPREGTFTYAYDAGKVVNLVAKPETGYKFVNWTGNVDDIADVEDATTTITMNDDYSITANFALEILEISNWYHLNAVRDNLGGNYLLIDSLDRTTTGYEELASEAANLESGWDPIGTGGRPFTGTFKGNDCEIRDMFITRPNEDYVGLFGHVGVEGKIMDLGVVNATLTGDENVGGLVGINEGGTVSNSYSTGSVSGGSHVGGLVGRNNDKATVSDSYSEVNVDGDDGVGGLVGSNDDKATVSDSYSEGSVTGKNGVGGLVGINDGGTVSDSYSEGNVTGENGVGGLVGRNWEGTVSNSYYNYEEVLIKEAHIITIGALSDESFKQWRADKKPFDINESERLSQKNGYYMINNVIDFKELLAFGQNPLLKFQLNSDLNLSDLGDEANFYIPYFAGEFDGNGFTISNLIFNFDFVCNVGLFGYLKDGVVQRVHLVDVNITGANFVGGLVGNNWEGTVSDSYSTGSITGNDDVGGLVGINDKAGIVENCNSTCSVTGNYHVGGLVGCNYGDEGTVLDSYSTGSVSGNRRVGGLVGHNHLGTIDKSYSNGSVTGSVLDSVIVGDVVGGLVGWNEGMVSQSYFTGSVSGDNWVGGLVGWNGKTVSRSYSTGSVSGDDWVGGLVGTNGVEGTVNTTYSIGTVTSVTGDEHVGGLVGENLGEDVSISKSFWDTETSLQDYSDGGIGQTPYKMKSFDTFNLAGWKITAVDNSDMRLNKIYKWNIVDIESYPDDATYPFLSWQP